MRGRKWRCRTTCVESCRVLFEPSLFGREVRVGLEKIKKWGFQASRALQKRAFALKGVKSDKIEVCVFAESRGCDCLGNEKWSSVSWRRKKVKGIRVVCIADTQCLKGGRKYRTTAQCTEQQNRQGAQIFILYAQTNKLAKRGKGTLGRCACSTMNVACNMRWCCRCATRRAAAAVPTPPPAAPNTAPTPPTP